jgi:hypothetical protein
MGMGMVGEGDGRVGGCDVAIAVCPSALNRGCRSRGKRDDRVRVEEIETPKVDNKTNKTNNQSYAKNGGIGDANKNKIRRSDRRKENRISLGRLSGDM